MQTQAFIVHLEITQQDANAVIRLASQLEDDLIEQGYPVKEVKPWSTDTLKKAKQLKLPVPKV